MKVSVIAHPNSKNPRIEKDAFNTIHVYVKEPARDGQANKTIIKTLARKYDVPKAAIKIIHGLKSKSKTVEIKIS